MHNETKSLWTEEQFNSLTNLRDPSRVYIELRTVESDPHCQRIITTGDISSPYTERLIDAILTYRREIGEFPSLNQVLFAISRNLHLDEELKNGI